MKIRILAPVLIIISIIFIFNNGAFAELTLSVAGKEIHLSTDKWKKVDDPASFAKNYQEIQKHPMHAYSRMVTVYLIPMSDDRKMGIKISDDEFLELFVVHSGLVTVQTRIDKGQYWVLCRETFKSKTLMPVDVDSYRPLISDEEMIKLWIVYQTAIDETRYLLRSQF